MSRGSRTWSHTVTSLVAALMLVTAVAPTSAGAAMITADTRPIAPTVGATVPVAAPVPPADIAAAARRIANLAYKTRPVPKPPVTYGPWRNAVASWYWEPQALAGGGYLRPDSMIVAHKSLPFGTRIQFSYRGRTCIATVMDRGPYVSGREFDLGPGTAKALGFDGVDTVAYRIVY